MSNLPTSTMLRALILAVGVALFSSSSFCQEGAKGQSVRPEIGKPLQAAIDLLKAKKGKETLLKLKEADAVADKTPYETYMVERVRGQAAAMAGDPGTAARSLEAAAVSPAAPAADRLVLIAGAAGQYYLVKDYAKCADLTSRYLKEGGTDPALRTLRVQALYLNNDFARAGEELAALIKAQEENGKPASEEQLQLYSTICLKQHDTACYGTALEKLLTRYPKPDYWLTAIYELTKGNGFPARHALDVARLKLYTHTMRTTGEYFEAAQLSMQDGYPAEAKDIIDRGYAAGLLGTGAEADRHRRLRDMVAKSLAEDTRTLGREDAAAAAAKDGTVLLSTGFNYVLRGQADKGLPMMEQGLQKGGFKHPDDAKLRLGIAQVLAGHGHPAAQTLAGVHGTDGTSELARLWAVAASHHDVAK